MLDLRSKVSAINQAFTLQLGLKTRKTNVKAQKIDNTTLETYIIIVVSNFSMLANDYRISFFKESFLLANVKLDLVLEIPFLTMDNVNVNF